MWSRSVMLVSVYVRFSKFFSEESTIHCVSIKYVCWSLTI